MFLTMHTTQITKQALQDAIQAFIARDGMTPTRFGELALGNRSFVGRLTSDCTVRLDTADRVLVFMGEAPIGPGFRAEVEAFLAVTGCTLSTLGQETSGNPSFVTRLRQGASPTLASVDRIRAWMAANSSDAQARDIRAVLDTGPAGNGAAPHSTVRQQEEATMDDKASQYLGTREAAAFLNLSPRTLDRYRVNGEGPNFHKFGNRVRYTPADLDAWAAERRWSSTSDMAAGVAPRGSSR